MTLLITHSACLKHLTPPGHPERPDRLRAIEQVLEHEKFMFLLREQCPRAELEIIALCHPWEYIERIRTAVPQIGLPPPQCATLPGLIATTPTAPSA